jgi:hypothetical protein
MFVLTMLQQILRITMLECGTRYHLGIEEGVLGELTKEYAVVAVCPIHHRRNAKAMA